MDWVSAVTRIVVFNLNHRNTLFLNDPMYIFGQKMKSMKKSYLLFIVFMLFNYPIVAQHFSGGIMGGLGATTVAGDRSGGYNKLGLYGGAFVNLMISQQSSLQMELAFFQKGAQSRQNPDQTDLSQYRLRLSYVELPFVYQYRLGPLSAEIGISFDFLIRHTEEVNYQFVERAIWKLMTFNSILGVKYDLTDKITLSLRKINSINSIHRGTYTGNKWRYIKSNMGAFNDAYLLSVYYRL